jgi:hypothetical protein
MVNHTEGVVWVKAVSSSPHLLYVLDDYCNFCWFTLQASLFPAADTQVFVSLAVSTRSYILARLKILSSETSTLIHSWYKCTTTGRCCNIYSLVWFSFTFDRYYYLPYRIEWNTIANIETFCSYLWAIIYQTRGLFGSIRLNDSWLP